MPKSVPATVDRAAFTNLRGWLPFFASFDGAVVDDRGDLVRWRSNIQLPLANGVLGGNPADVEETIAFFPPSHPFVWFTPLDDGTAAALMPHGLHQLELPAMVVHLQDLPALDLLDGIEIRIVDADPRALETATRISLLTNGFPPDAVEPFVEAYRSVADDARRSIMTFLATVDGTPAAASSLLIHDGVAGLYNVGTVEELRGRGLGTAVSLAALRAGRERGCDWGVLQATTDGEPLYRRLGFQERFRVALALRMPEPHLRETAQPETAGG